MDLPYTPAITSQNFKEFVRTNSGPMGYEERDRSVHALAGFESAVKLDKVIPRDEWKERIKDLAATRSSLLDLRRHHKILSKHQGRTKFCWVNAPVQACQYDRARAGLPSLLYSPASVGALVKNFKNKGGWGSQAFEHMAKFGVCTENLWPPNAIERRYHTAEAIATASRHIVEKTIDLEPRNFDQLATALLLNYPTAVGYSWWSHEVLAIALIVRGNGNYAIVCDNSGAGRGPDGITVLEESKASPDDAVALCSMRRSLK